MHLEILVEEPSAEAALQQLIPKIAPSASFRLHPHGGKAHLLDVLPGKLRSYSTILRSHRDWRVVVLLDEDRAECLRLKKLVLDMAKKARLSSSVLVRIAVEELEAWFLGDLSALRLAYPNVPASLRQRRGFRDPDAVPGGTWEALEGVLRKAGYHRAGLPKIEAARRIASFMDVENNDSRSFQVFRDGVRRLNPGSASASK